MTILVVEDERRMNSYIKEGLENEHFTVESVYDGKSAIEKIEINDYDVIILDILLPQKNGLEVCKEIRESGIETPVIMLTAKDTVEDRVLGLDVGADDYLIKPFALHELIARVRALLRREKQVQPTKLKVGDIVLDPASHEVIRGEKEVLLSSREYRLLDYMMRRPGRVCTKTMLGEHVWGYNFIHKNNSNVIEVFMSRLRKKVDGGFQSKLIITVPGVGYKLKEPKK
ncbi:response regulator transcription factor [uncultured Desulfosarcina sp.]|uniref:response regulator transcription factor n=1 Tax=uncultured Desulfosarcina sp. TaxID=218289 RepID=UPI0029C8BA86|nr:response regulator transcription factor [uncultured Desulfosarcina sp.]